MSIRNLVRVSVRLALAWGFFTFVNILINENPRFNGADLLALILMVGVGRLLYKQLKESGK
jgi:hypothetical protein